MPAFTKLTKTALKEYLKPPADFDWATTAWHPLSLDPDRSWFKIPCSCGKDHVIEWDGVEPTTYECDVDGTKYTLTPEGADS